MDKWDRLLVGEKSNVNTSRSKTSMDSIMDSDLLDPKSVENGKMVVCAREAPVPLVSTNLLSSRGERHLCLSLSAQRLRETDFGLREIETGTRSPLPRSPLPAIQTRQGTSILQRYGSTVLDLKRGPPPGINGDVLLQTASRGKGAVIWRPNAFVNPQMQQMVCLDQRTSPIRHSVRQMKEAIDSLYLASPRNLSVLLPSTRDHDNTSGPSFTCPLSIPVSNERVATPKAPVIDHRELWSKAGELSRTESDESCNSPGTAAGRSYEFGGRHRGTVPTEQIPPPSAPPPLPLHDFSKDHIDALPQTGHLPLLPAPKHSKIAEVQEERISELSVEENAALRDARRLSINKRADDCTCTKIEVFNARKSRHVKVRVQTPAAGVNQTPAAELNSCNEDGFGNTGDMQGASDLPLLPLLQTPRAVRYMEACYELQDSSDNTLIFESRFECGNLAKAYKINGSEYDLELACDIKTRGHTQWFYFSVSNMRKDVTYTINITNFCKRDSLYSSGLRPLMYSDTRAKIEGVGWSRCGANICYFSNAKPDAGGLAGGVEKNEKAEETQGVDKRTLKKRQEAATRERDQTRFTLSFEVNFPHDGDTVYLAHCFPYSCRDLQEFLDGLQAKVRTRKLFRRRVLTKTIANNDVEVITISPHSGSPEEQHQQQQQDKPVIVMSARVHPGETNSSWIMKGILQFLTDPVDPIAIALRNKCEFRLVPMLNPDGVINGNYRCNLAGCDLNRHWNQPSVDEHPTIYAHKNMVKELCKERSVLLALDLHGHSQKQNVFIYGCHSKYWKSSLEGDCGESNGKKKEKEKEIDPPPPLNHEQIYPFLLSGENDAFSFKDSSFKVQRCKASSGRVVCWREFKIQNSYTLEASFCGANQGAGKGLHFTTGDLENMGVSICKSLHRYLAVREDVGRMDQILAEIQAMRDKQVGEREDEDPSNSDSDEDLLTPAEACIYVQKEKAAKVQKEKSAKATSDTEDLSCADTADVFQTKRIKESSKMIIKRLARPKHIAEKKKFLPVYQVPWQNAAFESSLDPKPPKMPIMNRIRQHIDTLTNITKGGDVTDPSQIQCLSGAGASLLATSREVSKRLADRGEVAKRLTDRGADRGAEKQRSGRWVSSSDEREWREMDADLSVSGPILWRTRNMDSPANSPSPAKTHRILQRIASGDAEGENERQDVMHTDSLRESRSGRTESPPSDSGACLIDDFLFERTRGSVSPDPWRSPSKSRRGRSRSQKQKLENNSSCNSPATTVAANCHGEEVTAGVEEGAAEQGQGSERYSEAVGVADAEKEREERCVGGEGGRETAAGGRKRSKRGKSKKAKNKDHGRASSH